MPSERKPLFNARLLETGLAGFQPDGLDKKTATVARWRTTLERGRLQKTKETQLQGAFLIDFFHTVLGYTGLSEGADSWTYTQEETVEVDGKCADGVLGHFTDEHKTYVAAIELKGAGTSLDAAGSRGKSAVEQCYQYATNLPCSWVIVSNYRETRLYHKNRTQQHYESFRLEDLSRPEELKRFCYLLCADHLVARKGASAIDRLLEETGEEEERITSRLYAEYKQIRLTIFEALRRDNPGQDDHLLLEKTQKILDRVLFVCFCEDRGLLPHQIIDRAYEQQNPFSPVPIWRNFVGLFHAIDEGSEPLKIPGYNGGLFATDDVLDGLTVSDEVCELFRKLGHYDYAAEVNVDILGHIFEQSISDIEGLKAELAGETVDKKKSKRKKEGVYYTPETITRYIVEETVGGYLRGRFADLEAKHALDEIPTSHTRRRARAEIELWIDYQEALKSTRVLDPACGSGAFLIQAFDFLAAEYERCNAKLAALRGGQMEITDLNRLILGNNLYGVDINQEAVEITKLSLWIKTAERGKQLTYLDDNIQCGNSVIDDPAVDPRAFKWEERFPAVFAEDGFDCVVGNPPYIRGERIAPDQKAELQRAFPEVAHGQADIYFYFFERGLRVLRPGGALGFITANTYLNTGAALPLRRRLASVCSIRDVLDYVVLKPFADADMRPVIMVAGVPADPEATGDSAIRYTRIPDLETDLSAVADQYGCRVRQASLQANGWQFDDERIQALWQRICDVSVPLSEVVGKIYSGIKPGRTSSFVVSRERASAWIRQDPKAAAVLRPYYRGNEIRPWALSESDSFLLRVRDQSDYLCCGSIRSFLDADRDQLALRDEAKSGSCPWYALRACDYWNIFESETIVWPDTVKGPRAALLTDAGIIANTALAVASGDRSLLALLNSSVAWFGVTRCCATRQLRYGRIERRTLPQHMKDLPIAQCGESAKARLTKLAGGIASLHGEYHATVGSTLHRIESDLGDGKEIPRNPASSRNLTLFPLISFQDIRKEIKRLFRRDIPVAERAEWEVWLAERAEQVREIDAKIDAAEKELNAIVYDLYELTPDEVRLLEATIDPEPTTPTRRAERGQ